MHFLESIWVLFLVWLDMYLGLELLGQVVAFLLTLEELLNCFPIWLHISPSFTTAHTHTHKAHNSQGWARLKSGVRNSSQVTHTGGKTPVTWVITTALLPMAPINKQLNQEPKMGIKPNLLIFSWTFLSFLNWVVRVFICSSCKCSSQYILDGVLATQWCSVSTESNVST